MKWIFAAIQPKVKDKTQYPFGLVDVKQNSWKVTFDEEVLTQGFICLFLLQFIVLNKQVHNGFTRKSAY